MQLRLVLLLLVAGVVTSSPAEKDSRQSSVYSASSQYSDPAGVAETSHVVYDTLSSNNVAKQLSTGSAATNSFGFAASSNGGYSNTYSAPAAAPPAYIPPGNRPPQGYPDSGQPQPTIRPFQPEGGYSKPQGAIYQPQKPEESYAYYYQHYPGQSYGGQGNSYGNAGVPSLWPGDLGGDSDLFGGFGDLGSLGLGGAGIAAKGIGLGAIALAALAKGLLAIKPLLIIGALLVLTLPLLILFLPIPIISLSPPTANAGRTTTARQYISSALESAMTTLSEKVLNSEECLERIICKIPVVLPEKFQDPAKSLWTEYGSKFVKQPRLQRGLSAYFENTETKHRAFKCNQKFKCTNKFL